MTPFLQLAITLALFLAAAKLGGYLSYKIGQPSVLGELIVGIILGPSVLNFLGMPFFTDQHLPEVIQQISEIGVLLLMFLAGLELHLSDLLRSGKVAALAGILGVALPLALGAGTGLIFSMDMVSSIFIGLILSATSVSISAQTLMELKALRSPMGVGLLGAAVIDDILVLLGLSIFTALSQPGSSSTIDILWIIFKIGLFLVLASLIGWLVFPKVSRWVSNLPISQGLVTFALVILLFYGWTAEYLGHVAAITGSFFAGLWLGQTAEKERIRSSISTIAYGIFVPIFFINIGLSVNARILTGESGLLMVSLLLVAIIGKVIGSGYGAILGGLTRREALQLGAGMVSRGEVGLIVATIGIEQGLINESIFSVVLGIVILTTLLTPPMLRVLFPRKPTMPENVKGV
jgi:Na+:H+ antiporter